MQQKRLETTLPNRFFQDGPDLRLIGCEHEVRRLRSFIGRRGSRLRQGAAGAFDASHLATREPLVDEAANRPGSRSPLAGGGD